MKKIFLATTALGVAGVMAAMAAGPASAAEMVSLGLGGYMEQWVGVTNRDDDNSEGGIDTQSDSEVHFKGSLESDSGLKFTVHVELEGNQNAQIDESFLRVSGAFGTLEMGARDSIQARMHYGITDVGVYLNAGDTQKWIEGAYLDTNGWLGDNLNMIYISPRVSGLQVGLSYGPDAGNESASTGAPNGNDNAVWAGAINFNQAVEDANVKVSLGHRARSQATADDDTFTNMGVGVGFGSFGVNVAFAERDKGTGDPADQWSVFGASVSYSEGPVSLSLGHQSHETEADTARTATMLSAAYKLAPGVAWKSSIFQVDDDTGDALAAGTAFVTGLTVSF